MVEVVVAFAKCNHRGDHMITRSMLVVERGVPKPVCQRIDTKCRVVDKDKTGGSGIYVAPAPVTPE